MKYLSEKYFLFLVCLTFFFFNQKSNSQDISDNAKFNIETNIAGLQRICSLVSDSALKSFDKSNGCIKVKSSDASWLLESSLLNNAEKYNIKLKICDSINTSIYAVLRDCKVVYEEINQDSLRRKIIIDADFIINNLNQSLSRNIRKEAQDTINVRYLPQIESNEQQISKGISYHSSSSNFWDKVLEPAIILGSAALIIILFFTVRSK